MTRLAEGTKVRYHVPFVGMVEGEVGRKLPGGKYLIRRPSPLYGYTTDRVHRSELQIVGAPKG